VSETYALRVQTPPDALVVDGKQQWGRFDAAVGRANLIDAKTGWPRALRRWRLKEWQALQIAGPRVFVNLALFDAKLMSLLQAKIYDRDRGEKIVHEWKLRPGAFEVADQLLDSTTSYRDRRGSMEFSNRVANGRIAVSLDLAARGSLPRVSGSIEVQVDRGASQVVSLPFDDARGMYSHKGMFPVRGDLTVGARTYAFAPTDTLALLDDHKGYYPYVMKWDWITSAGFVAGRAMGFNLTRNQCREPDTYNENCAWIGDRIGTLPAVTFTREAARTKDERWIVRDRDGKVDVVFTPTVPGDVRVQAVVVESRYRGPFGTFTGTLAPAGLERIELRDWFGMGEEFWLRC